ncbi:MAG: protein kinase [Victivallaceae bacterium]|nr:protein kinase [Victivallaceae bacterium]
MIYHIHDNVGGFRLLAECGQGAYGAVFLAEHDFYGRVALKIVYKNGRNCERELKGLRSYMTICKRTDLLQIYHVDENDECFFYAMDAADDLGKEKNLYCPATLENRLKQEGRLAPEAILQMYEELASALKVLHTRGVCHRDLKPGNILWLDGRAVPGDIGLVSGDTQTMLAGTPGFMRSEVLAGTRPFAPEDDFYALGKVLYCALTGFPAEKYPAFPENVTISGAGKVIRLYNRLCAGEIVEPRPIRKPEKKISRTLRIVLAATAAILFIAAALYFAVSKYNDALQRQAQTLTREMAEAEKSIIPESAISIRKEDLPAQKGMRPRETFEAAKGKKDDFATGAMRKPPKIASVPATDNTTLETLHAELLEEWEKYRKRKIEIAETYNDGDPVAYNNGVFIIGDAEETKKLQKKFYAETLARLKKEECNLPRLREVAKFYLRHFPGVCGKELRDDSGRMIGDFYAGNIWWENRLNNRDRIDWQNYEKTLARDFDEPRLGLERRRSIYLGLRNIWTVEKIVQDSDFEKTLRRYGEILRELP